MPDRTYILFLVETLLIQGTMAIMYDCRRDNRDCSNNGKCQPQSGLCECASTNFVDYACFLDTTTIPVPCTKSCSNGGTCYGSPEACYCLPAYYGEFCEKRRVFVECEGDKMMVTLHPYTDPSLVYVTSYKDVPECKPQKDATTDDYTITINFEGGVCGAGAGDTVQLDKPGIGDITYQNFLVVQYSALVESPLDDIYTVSCLVSSNDTVPVSGSVSSITVDQRNDLMKDEAKGTYEGLLFELLNEAGVTLSSAQLGIPITLRISLKDTHIYKAIKVQSCEARDKSVDETSTLVLAVDGCASLEIPASYVIRSGFRGDVLVPENLPYVEMILTAFKFTSGPEVHFRCTVLLCREGDISCDATTPCPFGESKGKRKKRANGNEAEISGSLTIIDPYDRMGMNTQKGPTQTSTEKPEAQEECSMSREIMIILITLGITVFLLAVACVFLAMRYIRIKSVTTKPELPRCTVPVMNISKSY